MIVTQHFVWDDNGAAISLDRFRMRVGRLPHLSGEPRGIWIGWVSNQLPVRRYPEEKFPRRVFTKEFEAWI